MNGFQKEVRDKMLSVLPHAEIVHTTAPISDWQALAKTVASKIKKLSVLRHMSEARGSSAAEPTLKG